MAYQYEEEKVVAPTEGVDTGNAAQQETTATDNDNVLSPFLAQVNAKQAQANAAQQRANELLEAYNTARANGDSAIGALMQGSKPVRKEVDEKRLRNAAKIQAFGDVLSAATSGYFAFNKKGAGYVPNVSLNSPFKNLEKLNELEKEYQQRKLKWDADMLNYAISRETAKQAAAQSLYTAAQKRADDATKAADDAYVDLLKEYGDYNIAAMREAGQNKRAQAANQTRLAIAAMEGERADKKDTKEKSDARKIGWYDILSPWEARDIETETESVDEYGMSKMSKTRKKSTYSDDKEQRLSEAYTNDVIAQAEKYYKSGKYDEAQSLEAAVYATAISKMKGQGFKDEEAMMIAEQTWYYIYNEGYSYDKALARAAQDYTQGYKWKK